MKEVGIGSIVEWVYTYEIVDICSEGLLTVIALNGPAEGETYYAQPRSYSKIINVPVKDTRLARKLYPDYEVLDNGMLRIRS